MFDRNAFTAGFEARVTALAGAEKLTKESLRDLSRDLLHATFETEDIGYVNRTIDVLTPINRKVAVMFFSEFCGFFYEATELLRFTKKDKKRYTDVKEKALKALDDPHFNMWTWAERNIELAPKPFDLKKVTQFAENALKKAKKENIDQVKILEAFFAAGFEGAAIVAILEKLAEKQEQE